jgi:hypothetical protein
MSNNTAALILRNDEDCRIIPNERKHALVARRDLPTAWQSLRALMTALTRTDSTMFIEQSRGPKNYSNPYDTYHVGPLNCS